MLGELGDMSFGHNGVVARRKAFGFWKEWSTMMGVMMPAIRPIALAQPMPTSRISVTYASGV